MVEASIHPALAPLRSHFFPLGTNQERLHYVDEGQGEALVFLHGNPTWSFYFYPQLLAFRDRYRVLALDHLGCGLSSKPEKGDYRLEAHIMRLEAWIESLGLTSLTLVVHDWGGAIGMGYATRHPEHIRRMVITNSAAFLSPDIPKRIAFCRLPWIGEWAMRRWNAFARAAVSMASAKGLSIHAKKGLLAPYGSYADRVGIARFVQDIPLKKGDPSYGTLKRIQYELPTLRMPVLFLWGMQDFCFHKGFLARWIAYFPQGKVVRFEKAGHYLFWDEAETCIAIITEFLAHDPKGVEKK